MEYFLARFFSLFKVAEGSHSDLKVLTILCYMDFNVNVMESQRNFCKFTSELHNLLHRRSLERLKIFILNKISIRI